MYDNMNERKITTQEIAEIINVPVTGDNRTIEGLNLCNRDSVYNSIISYITNSKLIPFVRKNKKIKALILTRKLYNEILSEFNNITFFVTDNPEEVFYKLHINLFETKVFYNQYDFIPIIGKNCDIDSSAILENGVIIGDNVKIGKLSIIKKGSVIGNNAYIGYHSVVGSEGFQDIKINGNNVILPHVGGCKIGNNVSVLDNTCVCNSLFENTTKIGDYTKIDNLVHIAHNCIIGDNCTITAGTILCGSTIIENGVWIAPNVSVLNKVILKENSMVGLGAVVLKDVNKSDIVVGNPAKSIKK